MRRFGGRRAVFLRVIAIWLITAATLILLSALLSGVEVTSFRSLTGRSMSGWI